MEAAPDVNFFTALLPLALVLFIIAVGVTVLNQHFRKNLYKQKLAQQELKSHHQHELLRASIVAQEEERHRIATDLHDELGASLSITRMHLLQLEKKSGSEPLHDELKNIRGLVESALASMRRVSHELMPPQLATFGLSKTLEAVAHQIEQARGVRIHLQDYDNALSWQQKLGLYRVSMELINNTLRHSGARNIWIGMKHVENSIQFHYYDDGVGLDEVTMGKGIGLKSIEARTSFLGGTMELGNGSKGGFEAVIVLPLSEP